MNCKICGGSIEFISGEFMKCEYCGQIYDLNYNQVSNEQVYNKANVLSNAGTIESNQVAYELFDSILSYRNSAEKAQECINNIERLEVLAEEKQLEDRRQQALAQERAMEQEKINHRNKKIGIVAVVCIGILLACFGISAMSDYNALDEKYSEAFVLLNDGYEEEALEIFKSLDGFKESERYVTSLTENVNKYEVEYKEAIALFESKDYEGALLIFEKHKRYKDSLQYINFCSEEIYAEAEYLYAVGNFESAKLKLESIPEYADTHEKKIEFQTKIEDAILLNEYNRAVALYKEKSYEDAQKLFLKLGKYQDAVQYLSIIGQEVYQLAQEAYNAGNYISCGNWIVLIDELNEWNDYAVANQLLEKTKSAYKTQVDQNALNVLKEKGYGAFEQYIKGSVNQIYSKKDAETMVQECNCLEVYQIEDKGGVVYNGSYSEWFTFESGLIDSEGIKHENVLTGGHADWKIYLGQKYDRLSGTVFIREEAILTGDTLWLKIFGDNERLLYSIELRTGEKPASFVIDVSKEEDIRIEFAGYNKFQSTREKQYFGGIGELVLYNIPE